MRYNLLGRTGLYVSELCLGTMTFGGKGFWEAIGKLGQKQVETLVGTSLDGGVNFIDTADVYSFGESEQLLGNALKALARPREQAEGLARFQTAQVYYSIAGRDIEREIVPMAQSEGLAILPWSPLAGGLLSGKFDPDKPGPEGARRTGFDFPPVDRARLPRVLSALRVVATETGVSVARVALAWLLGRPFVTSVIIGAKTVEQLTDNLAAADVTLSAQHRKVLDEASALPSEYPGWMIEFQNRDPRGIPMK
jgi:aryl-alcohol dehydrogenase-like predicted oxidoreductase